jgi:superfamily II DNA helicase RecQ
MLSIGDTFSSEMAKQRETSKGKESKPTLTTSKKDNAPASNVTKGKHHAAKEDSDEEVDLHTLSLRNECFDRLRGLRNDTVAQRKIQPASVFDDALLLQMAKTLPTTEEDFKAIPRVSKFAYRLVDVQRKTNSSVTANLSLR